MHIRFSPAETDTHVIYILLPYVKIHYRQLELVNNTTRLTAVQWEII